MVSHVVSLGVSGVAGYVVSVECFLSGGLPGFDVVGLPDAAVRESRERVRAAIKTLQYEFPPKRITVNLAPADTRKEGALYDLPILLGLMSAHEEIPPPPDTAAFLGEVSLSGVIRPVCGVLAMTLAAKKAGLKEIYLPADNASEALLAEGIDIYPVDHVQTLLQHLLGRKALTPARWAEWGADVKSPMPDFAQVRGQENAKRALEIAAAGGHNVLMIGPPGTGKSMLARRLPSILPDFSYEERVETTVIHSVAGLTGRQTPFPAARPFRSPHHTISAVGLTGGGAQPRPGEISLAHNGVLFLDELPEFNRNVLDALRQPLEEGQVTITRAQSSTTFPARFTLVCAMNPCRCGWLGHESGRCRCSEASVESYRSRVSGPMLDRIDLQVEVPLLTFDELSAGPSAETSADIRARVELARQRQRDRLGAKTSCNARMTTRQIEEHCHLTDGGRSFLRNAFERMGMTGRAYSRVLKVARTISDLEDGGEIRTEHLAEAVQYRSADRRGNI